MENMMDNDFDGLYDTGEFDSFGMEDTDIALDGLVTENQVALSEPVSSPIYIQGTHLEEGKVTIDTRWLKEYYDKALHLDKKDDKTYITLVCMNNYCFVYSLNVGVELYALYGCQCSHTQPLIFSLPINRILKLLNGAEMITFDLEEDIIHIRKANLDVDIQKVAKPFYLKECERYVNNLFKLYELTPTDTKTNVEWSSMLSLLGTYSRLNKAENRLILLDKQFAYVRSSGYYVFAEFVVNTKYVINSTFASLLNKLCTSSTMSEFNVSIICDDTQYIVVSNNYVLNFPMLNGDFKFNIISKIQPVTYYQVSKQELAQALQQVDLYTEHNTAITVSNPMRIVNKTVQGTAKVDISSVMLENTKSSQEPTTYAFNYSKFARLVNCIKGDIVSILECNTEEHLYLSDEKATHYIIMSVK